MDGATFDDAGFRQRSPEPEPIVDAAVANEDAGMRDATPVALEDVGGEVVDSIVISHDDARFLIGSRGSTKAKLAKVSGARLEVSAVDPNAENGNQRLDIKGSAAARAKAKRYCEWVLRQRVGTIMVDTSTQSDDVTIMDVPASCTAYVTGHAGSGLRRIEEENSSLMFFGKPTTDPEDAPEKLMICGSRKARRGSELSVMSSVERRDPGTYVGEDGKLKVKFEQPGDGLNDGWGFDIFPFANEEEMKFAVGAQVGFLALSPRFFFDLLFVFFTRCRIVAATCVRMTSRSVRGTTMSNVRSLELSLMRKVKLYGNMRVFSVSPLWASMPSSE